MGGGDVCFYVHDDVASRSVDYEIVETADNVAAAGTADAADTDAAADNVAVVDDTVVVIDIDSFVIFVNK